MRSENPPCSLGRLVVLRVTRSEMRLPSTVTSSSSAHACARCAPYASRSDCDVTPSPSVSAVCNSRNAGSWPNTTAWCTVAVSDVSASPLYWLIVKLPSRLATVSAWAGTDANTSTAIIVATMPRNEIGVRVVSAMQYDSDPDSMRQNDSDPNSKRAMSCLLRMHPDLCVPMHVLM